jgi:23S rRNA pseudouridine2605 synthase
MKAESTLKEGLVRLEKHVAHAGISSRREAKDLITQGLVLVNDTVITEPGFGINPEKDVVSLKTDELPTKETILLYKPRGIETNATSDESDDIAMEFPELAHLSPIGRLDKESEGLILLSNDGTLARALTQKDSHVEKEYLVTVREEVMDDDLEIMSKGILLDDTMTKSAVTERDTDTSFTIILKEGRKHQIRRMCDACRLTVTSLKRIRIGHLTVGKMKSGDIKMVSESDVQKLKI